MNLSSLKKYVPLITITIGGAILVLIVVYGLIAQYQVTVFNISPLPNQNINTVNQITISFNKNIESICQIDLNPEIKDQAKIELQNDSVVVGPNLVWPTNTDIQIKLDCRNYQATLVYHTKDVSEQTLDEQAQEQAALDYDFAQTVETYYQERPFIEYFPIHRERYTLYFSNSRQAIIVSPEEPLSAAEKDNILTIEQELLAPYEIPEDVPFVFSDEI